MSFVQALVLGVIQGFTEFLPISSSGHLVFVPKIFNWADQGLAFDVVVHLGSLVAVIVYFRKKLWLLIKAFFSRNSGLVKERRLAWFLLLSIIPAGIVGWFGKDWIEEYLRSALVIGVGLIVWGIVLLIADRLQSRIGWGESSLETLNWKKVLFISCAQAIALIPGTSRSGITMSAGLFSKLDRKSAAEFSFLMSVPVILLAGLVKVVGLLENGLGDLTYSTLLVGLVSAAFSGWLAVSLLMKIIQKWSFTPFVVYRVVVGILIILFLV